jgi:mannose-1-phosphate guanylyltransferase
MPSESQDTHWCIVQADRDTAAATPCGPVPIQFCSALPGSPSFLQRSLKLALQLVNCRRLIVTVAETHRAWWSEPLWWLPARRRIVDDSTGRLTVTLAVAVAQIERLAANAIVVVLPTDRLYAAADSYVVGIRKAAGMLGQMPDHIVTLAASSYGVLEPQDYVLLAEKDDKPGRPVARVVRRPVSAIATRLKEWRVPVATGIHVARVATFADLIGERWPRLMTRARNVVLTGTSEIRMPARMPESLFSRPWRHTWVQRPLPRLRAVLLRDFGYQAEAFRTNNRLVDVSTPTYSRHLEEELSGG